MKFKCTLSSMGVTWLERFVPIFEKMGKELSVLFTPETLHLVQGAADSGVWSSTRICSSRRPSTSTGSRATTLIRSRSSSKRRRCTAC